MLGLSFTGVDVRLRSRVAAVLLLLYAQPVSRSVRLTIGDVKEEDDQVLIKLGDPPSPVPQPFGALLLGNAASLPTQFVGQYMHNIGTTAGIFLVLWTSPESRSATAPTRKVNSIARAALVEHVGQQEREQVDRGRDVRVFTSTSPTSRHTITRCLTERGRPLLLRATRLDGSLHDPLPIRHKIHEGGYISQSHGE